MLAKRLRPPPKLTVSEWANKYRILPQTSPEPGRYKTNRAPYQVGMMDAFTEPGVTEVTIMAGTQLGKTEVLNNVVGYFIAHDPCTIMVVQPTLPMAMYWSKKRLSPMLRDTPKLAGLISEINKKAKDSSNTILEKDFPGGDINIAGANSPSSLASRPRRVVLFDEVNKYPSSAGAEGDPISLGEERASNYWNRVKAKTSTPGVKGVCRIEHAFEQSDKRYYHVPCPNCPAMFILKWGGPKAKFGLKWDEGNPESAYYVCQNCAGICYESDKPRMLTLGRWIATAAFNGKAGFHINKLYSPWVTWPQIIADFLEKKKLPETLKVFINSTLAETWEEKGGVLDTDPLMSRREYYPAEVPAEALVLTAYVDVQADRLEIEWRGWGVAEESWGIYYEILHGDPSGDMIWKQLESNLDRTFKHETGGFIKALCWAIDSGYLSDMVYRFCGTVRKRNVYATKGSSDATHPVIAKKAKVMNYGARLFVVGPSVAKEIIYGRLKVEEPGPGYCHFPMTYDEEYFDQLTAEQCVVKHVSGFPRRVWELRKGKKRNEALDLFVGNYAALKIINPNLEAIKNNWAGWQRTINQQSGGGSGTTGRRVLSKGV